jgi:hypothetical protein
MAVAIEIKGQEYVFELNRMNYRKYVLQDTEYSAIQTKLASLAREKKVQGESTENATKAVAELIFERDVTLLQQITMVEQEKIFYASLILNQPDITVEKAVELLDLALEEYGEEEVGELCRELTANFTPKGEKTEKKKMVRRVV